MDEIATCVKHGNYNVQNIMFGKERILRTPSDCPVCDKEKQEVHQINWKEQQENQMQAALFKDIRLPLRFAERDFDNYNHHDLPERVRVKRIAKAFADNFAERADVGGSLIFCGKPGTGKTHLAAAIARSVTQQGFPVLFLSTLQAIRSIKDCYGKDSAKTETQALNYLFRPRLLILDEVGVQFGSEAERIILFEILNGRYEKLLPTVLVSNLTEKELAPYLGERVLDRFSENGGTILAFTWDSYRRTQK